MAGRKQGSKGTSSTGKVKDVQADQTNWRTQLRQSRIKFDDEQKQIYLAKMAETGLKGESARAAGVSLSCVQKHRDNDEEFAEAEAAAMKRYSDFVASAVRARGIEGYEEPVFFKGVRAIEPVLDENGAQVLDDQDRPIYKFTGVRKFSDRMLEMEAKRTNEEYRDKQTIDLNANAGVLVAPEGMDPEDWIAEQEAKNANRKKPGDD